MAPLPFNRAIVIGSSGSGKSTFARRLGDATGVPVVHIDQLFWEAGWQMAPAAVYQARIEAAVANDRWIIDGVDTRTLDLRLPRTDIVFWLDRSRWACLWRVARRIATSYGQVRPDMAAGCPEKIDIDFLRFIWTFHERYDHRIAAAIERHGLQSRTLRLRSDRATQAYLDRLALN